MKKFVHLQGFLALLFLAAACQPNTDDIVDPIVNVPVDFTIDFRETLNNLQQDDLTLSVQTVNLYDCEDVQINAEVSRSTNTFVVRLDDIIEPDDCVTLENNEPANELLQLKDLETGLFPILIKLKNTITNQGELRVDNFKYSIEMESTDGIEFTHQELYRVPEQFIWGYISYEGEAGEVVASTFFNAAQDETTPVSISTGYYGYFDIDDSKELTMSEQGLYINTTTFYYHFEGEKGWLIEMIDAFNQNTENAKVELKIFTSEGEAF